MVLITQVTISTTNFNLPIGGIHQWEVEVQGNVLTIVKILLTIDNYHQWEVEVQGKVGL